MNMKTKTEQNSQRCVWMVGYPRSGNTWLNYLCAYCLNLPFSGFDDGAKVPKQEWVRQAVSGQNPWPSPAGFQAVRKTHKLPAQVPVQNGKVIYVQRDPRDVFVSHSYYMKYRAANSLRKYRFQLLALGGRRLQMRWFLFEWKRHVSAWRPYAHAVISYERLQSEGANYLAASLQQAGFEISNDVVQQALDCFRFEKMTGGREAGQTDTKSFFRSGVVGDWKNHLNEGDNELFRRALSEIKFA